MSQQFWFIAGSPGFTDLTEPLHKTLKDFIVSKWIINNPSVTDIRFKMDWWDGYGDYQIHFRSTTTPISILNLGWSHREYQELVDIHIFVRQNVPEEPTERDNIKREIQRIIGENKDQLSLAGATKNSYMEIIHMNNESLSSTEANIWHTIIGVRITYWKISTD